MNTEEKEDIVELIKYIFDRAIVNLDATICEDSAKTYIRILSGLRAELYELEAFEEYDSLSMEMLRSIEDAFVEER